MMNTLKHIVSLLLSLSMYSTANSQDFRCNYPNEINKAIEFISEYDFQNYLKAQKAIERYLASKPLIKNECLAKIYHKLGLVKGRLYPLLDSSESIIYLYKQASDLWQLDNNRYDEFNIKLINNIAIRYFDLGGSLRLDSFPTYIKKGLTLEKERLLKNMSFSPQYARVCHFMGNYYDILGDNESAKDHYLLSADLFKEQNKEFNLAQVYNDLSWLFAQRLDDPIKGVSYAEKALILTTDPALLISININLITAIENQLKEKGYFNKGKEIINTFDEIFSLGYESEIFQHYPLRLVTVQNNIAEFLNSIGNHQRSKDTLLKSIKILEGKYGDVYLPRYRIKVYDNLGESNEKLGLIEQALNAYQKSISSAFPGYKGLDLLLPPSVNSHQNPNPISTLTPLSSKARLLKQQADQNEQTDAYLLASLNHYLLMDSLIADIQQGFISKESLRNLAEKGEEIYEDAIALCVEMDAYGFQQQDYKALAWYFAERNKSISLLKFMNETSVADRLFSEEEEEALRVAIQSRDYYKRLLAEGKLAASEVSGDSLRSLAERSIQAQNRLLMLKEELAQKYPEYEEASTYTFSQEELAETRQKLIGDEQAIVEYFLGDSASFLFIIDQSEIAIHSLTNTGRLPEDIRQLRKAIQASFDESGQSVEKKAEYISLAYPLYKQLLSQVPFEKYKRLLIVPDKALFYLPFELLLTEAPAKMENWQLYQFLGIEKALSYSFSSALLKKMHDNKSYHQPKTNWGSFAPIFPMDSFPNGELGDLSYSAESAKISAEQYHGTYFGMNRATKNNFLMQADAFQFLQLATHSYVYDSSLVKVEFWDQPVYLDDLYSLKLNAELVILNACQTNMGKTYTGDGVASLNSGFVSAGAGSILTTLWDTKDSFTEPLMNAFLRELNKGKSKDEALRLAKKTLLVKGGRDQSPFLWGSYVLYGDMSPSPVHRGIIWTRLWIILFILVLVLSVFILRRKLAQAKIWNA